MRSDPPRIESEVSKFRQTNSSTLKPLELAVVIPTYNERENIRLLVLALANALQPLSWEAIFVDDNSPDGTADLVRSIALTDHRIRVLERIGRRGLSSACIEGMLATSARYIAVMDGDLQHDETVLPNMLNEIKTKRLDLVIATRKVMGGSMGNMSRTRKALSNVGAWLSRAVCRCPISDPMGGFFIVDRVYLNRVVYDLTGVGFKILVDLLASAKTTPAIAEVPYRFRNREKGSSKLDLNVELEYLHLLVSKTVGRYLPTRFVFFVTMGGVGLLLHLMLLSLLYYRVHASFWLAQVSATYISMSVNFVTNNAITFHDVRLRGLRLFTGLLTFYFACSIGALINIAFAMLLLRANLPWWVAGVSGMALSSLWNYGASTIFTWRQQRLQSRRYVQEVNDENIEREDKSTDGFVGVEPRPAASSKQ